MSESTQAVAIVRVIMDLAQSLTMEVIAEGAETAAEVRILESMNCPFVQGNYFSRPLSKQAAAAALSRTDWPA